MLHEALARNGVHCDVRGGSGHHGARARQPPGESRIVRVPLSGARPGPPGLRDYERAWRAKDASALADLFADDGFVLSDGSPPAKGRVAIRKAYANAGGPLWLRALGHATDGDVGYIIGVFGHKQDGPVAGKFILALRRRAGGPWLIAADMDNSIAQPDATRP